MEQIRRKIKIFWLEHNGPIKLYTLVIVGVIAVVQILDQIAIDYNKYNKSNSNIVSSQSAEEKEEIKENIYLIDIFIKYCTEQKIEGAYKLLSQDCKNDKYPNLEDFKNNYYNKIFNKKLNIEVEFDSKTNLYKVTFYEDMLESGKIEGRDNIVQYCKIQQENQERKIYLNANK